MDQSYGPSEWGETPVPSPRPIDDMNGSNMDDTASTRVADLYDNEPGRMSAPAPFTDRYEQPTAMDSESMDNRGMVRVQQKRRPKNNQEAFTNALQSSSSTILHFVLLNWMFFKSCRFAVSTCNVRIAEVWLTKDTVDPRYDKDLHIKATIRELIIYFIFLIVLCFIVYGSVSTSTYHLSTSLTSLFTAEESIDSITFEKIQTKEQYWNYLEGPLMNALYQSHWYDKGVMNTDEMWSVLHESRILSQPHLRMLKVKSNDGCKVVKSMEGFMEDCYAPYKSKREDKRQFGPALAHTWNSTTLIEQNYPYAHANGNKTELDPKVINDTTKIEVTGWDYRTSDDLDGSSFWGQITHYGGGGFVQLLPITDNLGGLTAKQKAAAILSHLRGGNWIDRGTRAVFLDFLLYNANLNLFIISRVSIEFPAMGGAVAHTTFTVVELLRYTTDFDKVIFAMEIIYCIFIVYYIIEEMIEISIKKTKYFRNFWNIMDIIVLVISLFCIAFSVYRYLKVRSMVDDYLVDHETDTSYLRYNFASFEFLAFSQQRYYDAVAILVFCAWVKLFKYISFSRTLNSMNDTLARAAKDIAAFAVMFFIFFFAYAQLGYLAFGTNIKDYSTFKDSVFTLLRMILGDFKFNELEVANRIIGPIYFLTFIFLVFFILINMFLAIIIDTYSEVKAELQTQKSDFEISDYLSRGYHNVLRRLHLRKDRLTDIQSTIDQGGDSQHKQIDYGEWKESLVQRGFSEEYIESMFAKYDTDGDRVLTDKEIKKIEQDLAEEKGDLTAREKEVNQELKELQEDEKDSTEIPTDILSYEEFNVLNIRLDGLEKDLRIVLNNLDTVVDTLENRERTKSLHRERMANIIASNNASPVAEKTKTENFVSDVSTEMNRFFEEYK